AYADAFRAYGLPVLELDPQQAAARIQASAIREQLVAALDDWVFRNPLGTRAGQQKVQVILRLADPRWSWRGPVRDATRRKDRAVLERLARHPRVFAQPTTTLVLLADCLAKEGARPAALALLHEVQQRHPDDFWVNHDLAFQLTEMRPPRNAE